MQLLSESQIALARRVKQMVERSIAPNAVSIEGTPSFPEEAFRAFQREGLFTLAMPRPYGGLDADATSLSLMVEQISRYSPSAALQVFPTNSVVRTLALTGTAEQQDRFFGDIRAGDKLCAFCLTEPNHGSDAASLETHAERDGDYYVVRGSKAYITLGPNASWYLTFVRTGPGKKAAGISALMIPRDAENLSFGPPEKKMGLAGSITSPMFMDGVRVPVANRLWAEGEGWRVLTEIANPMRVWGAASMALGAAQGLLDQALDYARNFKVEGRSLASQQSIGFTLANMKMKVESARSLIRRTCALVDSPGGPERDVESFVSMSKCYAADVAMEVSEMAGQVMGPAMCASDSLAGLLFRAVKAIQIFDGSNQIQRLILSRNLARG